MVLGVGGDPVADRAGALGRWIEREALEIDQLNGASVSAFHLEHRGIHARLPTASVWPLLEYLRAEGAVPPEPRGVVEPVGQLVGEYGEYLQSGVI